MMAPIDYTIGGPSPMDKLQQGLSFGQGMRANEQAMQLATNQDQRAQATFENQQTQFAQEQAAAQAQQAQAAKLQGDLAGLSAKVADGTATFADFAGISLAHPDLAAQLKTVWDGQSEERKKNDIAGLYRAGAAIKSGKPELAIKALEDYATAAENAGQKMDADMARATAGIIKADPSAGLTQIGMLLHGVDEDAAKALFGEVNSDRFKVVGDQLVDLGGEGGPKPVDLGAPKGPDWRDATPEEAGKYGAQFGQLNTKTGEFKPMNPPSNGITITNPDGSTTQIGGPAGGGKPLTESQSKDVGFATRMDGALAILDGTSEPGKDPVPGVADALTSRMGRVADMDPTGVLRSAQTDDFQRARQAGNEFLTGLLRKDSGGAITKEEMDTYGVTYLPQPGDGAAILADKKAARARAVRAIKAGLPADAILSIEKASAGGDGSGSQTKSTPIVIDGYTIEESP